MYLNEKLKEFVGEPLKAVRAEPFSLESLIAWLETKDANASYDWYSISGCLICQYLDHIGVKFSSVGANNYVTADYLDRISIPRHFPAAACPSPHTFGDALERARAYKAAAQS